MHNFKKKIGVVTLLVGILLVNAILNYALIPNRHMRVDLHNLEVNEYQDLYMGTSHGFAAFQTPTLEKVTGRKSYNIARGGEYPRDAYFLLKYASQHHKPKRVIYEVDLSYWVNPDGINDNYNVAFHEMSWGKTKLDYFMAKLYDKDFRVTLFPWFYYRKNIKEIPRNLKEKRSKNYKEYGIEGFKSDYQTFQEGGFMNINRFEKGDKDKNPILLWDQNNLQGDSKRDFLNIAKYCKQNNIEFIAVTTPIPMETINRNPESYKKGNLYLTNLMKKNRIPFYNFNYIDMKGFDKSIQNYADYDGHMFGDAAKIFSEQMWSYIK